MLTSKPSAEIAARRARVLIEAARGFDFTLGDPAPGRSALEQLRNTPPTPPKPAFKISAARGDGGRDDRVRTTLLVERAERQRRR
jgi:hypothetical protein